MKGQIANFSPQHGQGIIMGEDGKNYPFSSQQWQHNTVPVAGEAVEFMADMQGHAINIQSVTHLVSSSLNLNKSASINPYQAPQSFGHQNAVIAAAANAVNPVWAEEENYGFFDWVKKCLHNYANFKGRARRKEYWFFYLAWVIVYLLAIVVDYILGTEGIIAGLFALAFFIPNIAVGVRRLHDIDKSGWWTFISLIPLIGGILLLVWYCTDTKPQVNQWGPPARRV